jgi:hypothetical protein
MRWESLEGGIKFAIAAARTDRYSAGLWARGASFILFRVYHVGFMIQYSLWILQGVGVMREFCRVPTRTALPSG